MASWDPVLDFFKGKDVPEDYDTSSNVVDSSEFFQGGSSGSGGASGSFGSEIVSDGGGGELAVQDATGYTVSTLNPQGLLVVDLYGSNTSVVYDFGEIEIKGDPEIKEPTITNIKTEEDTIKEETGEDPISVPNVPTPFIKPHTVPECGPIMKIKLPYGKYNNEREIRPEYTKRNKGEKKFILDMVDSTGQSYLMSMGDCSIVSAISLTPTPDSLVINSSKIINRYHTMTRWIEEHWGDEIDTITFSGGTFGLFEYYDDREYQGEGLSVVNRRKTKPYEMLKEIVKLYRTNGMLYHDAKSYDDSSLTQEFIRDRSNSYFLNNHPRRGLPKERLYIKLHYDYITCLGYIDSFDLTEDSSSPFRLRYSMTYRSEKTIYNQGVTANRDRVPLQVDTNFNVESKDNTYGGLLDSNKFIYPSSGSEEPTAFV